jgi:3-oxoacyl-[acyl-carrier protein] reductase
LGKLTGRVAIVTGGAWGIGGATCRRLAAEGAKVLVADVDDAAAASNVERITEAGGVARAFHADVRIHDDIRAMVSEATGAWGRLDILVNNAFSPTATSSAAARSSNAIDTTEEDWDAGIALLIKPIFLGAKYAVPVMRETGGGSIVNMASVHGLAYAPGWLVYETGKTAVIGITRQLATEYGPDGIRVNAINPGHIVTEKIQASLWDDDPDGLDFMGAQYPLRKTGVPDDIANAVAFLCSDDASFITGHDLTVDGGLTIQIQENLAGRIGDFVRAHPDTQIPPL